MLTYKPPCYSNQIHKMTSLTQRDETELIFICKWSSKLSYENRERETFTRKIYDNKRENFYKIQLKSSVIVIHSFSPLKVFRHWFPSKFYFLHFKFNDNLRGFRFRGKAASWNLTTGQEKFCNNCEYWLQRESAGGRIYYYIR